MTCAKCLPIQHAGFVDYHCKGIDYVDQCARQTDRVSKLSDENHRFMFLWSRIQPLLSIGDGGHNPAAIDFIFNEYRVDPGVRPILLDRCLVMIDERNKGRKRELDALRNK